MHGFLLAQSRVVCSEPDIAVLGDDRRQVAHLPNALQPAALGERN